MGGLAQASGLVLGLAGDLAWGLGFGLLAGLGCSSMVGLGCGCFGLAVGLGFVWAVSAGFAGVRRRPVLLAAGRGPAGVLVAASAPVAGTIFWARVAAGVNGWGVVETSVCEVLDEEVVVVVEVGGCGCEVLVEEVEEAQEVDGEDEEEDEENVGDAGTGFRSSAAVGVLWAMRVRVRAWTFGVRARFLWCPACMQVLVPRAVPRVVRRGVVGSPWFVGMRAMRAGSPTPPRPISLLLCTFMVAVRLLHLLWPDNTPTQHYPHLMEEDMLGIQRAFFGTTYHIQQAHPHALHQTSPPKFWGASLYCGRRVTFHVQLWGGGISQNRWVHSARQYMALPRT